MASLEMLKKLLDEFAEKEAHTREEINVVTQQIVELEQRAESARARQGGIAGDRDRLNEMKAHYANGAIKKSAPVSGGVPLPVQTPQLIPAAAAPPPPPPLPVAPAEEPAQTLSNLFSTSPAPVAQAAPAPVPIPAPAPAPEPAKPVANKFDLLDLFSPNEPEPAPAPEPIPAAGAPAAPATAAETPKEEEDDTVKSINDALRGLFR